MWPCESLMQMDFIDVVDCDSGNGDKCDHFHGEAEMLLLPAKRLLICDVRCRGPVIRMS